MRFIRTSNTDTRFVELCSMLDQYLISVMGEEKQQKEYNKHNMLVDIDNVILLVDGEKPIGCAGLKRIDATTAEIKRVLIADEFRHHGYGRKMISEIEYLAQCKGYKVLLLETGVPMKSAWEFYASCGFSFIENYGPYAGMDSSVCMKKNIENYLETERLILRPIKDSDARDIFEYCKNPNVGPAAGWEPHKNIEDTRRIMKEIFIGKENIFGIVLKSSGKIIGSIGLHTESSSST